MIYPTPYSEFSNQSPRGSSRDLESLLWVAAGAAWAVVAVRAWGQARREGARRKTQTVSERLLGQVFPHGLTSRP